MHASLGKEFLACLRFPGFGGEGKKGLWRSREGMARAEGVGEEEDGEVAVVVVKR